MTLTFRTRIALWSVAASGLVLLVFVAASALLFFDNMLEEADHVLRESSAQLVAQEIAGTETHPPESRLPTVYLSSEEAKLSLVGMHAPDGTAIFSDTDWPARAEVAMPLDGTAKTRTVRNRLWRVHGQTIEGYRISLALDIAEIRSEVLRMAGTFLRAVPFGLLFIALGAWWIAGRAVKPVREIANIAERITPEGLGQRVPASDAPDEIGRLGRVLNRMMDRLEAAFKQARRFSSDASHELRTPLAVMQGKLEAALQRAEDTSTQRNYADLLEQVQNLKTITDSLLMFSRSDVGSLTLALAETDVGELVEELVDDIRTEAEERDIDVRIRIDEGLCVRADPRLLRMAVYNLFQNAIKYNRPTAGERGEVSGTVHAGPDTSVEILVGNTGPQIPRDQFEKIFDRFHRGGADASMEGGFGLGLSLARVIVRAHRGTVDVADSTPERTTFRIRLPIAGDARK